MTTFGDDLIRSLGEALAHAKGEGPAIVHPAVSAPAATLESCRGSSCTPDPAFSTRHRRPRRWRPPS